MLLAAIVFLFPIPQSGHVAKMTASPSVGISSNSSIDSSLSQPVPAAPEPKVKTDAEVAADSDAGAGATAEPDAPTRAATALAGAPTTAAQTAALLPLEQYVAANLPIIPTTTASEWFEYNSQNYTGWPTQQNPYDSGHPSGTNNGPGSGTDEVVILHLRPR